MPYCSKCGALVPESATFCQKCRQPQPASVAQMLLTLTEARVIAAPDGTVVVRGNEGEIVLRGQCAKELQHAYANQEDVDIRVTFTDQTEVLSS